MKHVIYFLPAIFFSQVGLAESIEERAANDYSVCRINDKSIELETLYVSPNNPIYTKEAVLVKGLKAIFAQEFNFYTATTYTFKLVLGKEILGSSVANVDYLQNSGDNFRTNIPTLNLNQNVIINNETYVIKCDFYVDGHKYI